MKRQRRPRAVLAAAGIGLAAACVLLAMAGVFGLFEALPLLAFAGFGLAYALHRRPGGRSR